MFFAASTPEAHAKRRAVQVHGQEYWLSEYVGAAPVRGAYMEGNEVNDNKLPQGFLVDQPPGAITPPHFHEVNQFQVFVAGAGRMGRHDTSPVSVHYASGHTPYGPIVAGDQGVKYFTLRGGWDPGAKYMPKSRDRLKPVRRRSRLADKIALSDAAALRQRDAASIEVVLAPEGDGLSAHLLRLGALAAAECPDPAFGDGQYCVVVNGSLRYGKQEFPLWSCLYLSRDELPLHASAGTEGLELLVLQLPRTDAARAAVA